MDAWSEFESMLRGTKKTDAETNLILTVIDGYGAIRNIPYGMLFTFAQRLYSAGNRQWISFLNRD